MISDSVFLRLLERHKESGLSVRSFCLNEGIAPSTFYYRQKKIRKESEAKRFIPLVVQNQGSSVHPVSPLANGSCMDDACLEITYGNGTTLKIKHSLDLGVLRSLVSLLD